MKAALKIHINEYINICSYIKKNFRRICGALSPGPGEIPEHRSGQIEGAADEDAGGAPIGGKDAGEGLGDNMVSLNLIRGFVGLAASHDRLRVSFQAGQLTSRSSSTIRLSSGISRSRNRTIFMLDERELGTIRPSSSKRYAAAPIA